mmetsp:Transcript_106224/g.343198  ORF Transcript_106224/g.343198 Transcript_106224/m.343198 type:complete len:109 (+) Transcript_106224:756-1082(+)
MRRCQRQKHGPTATNVQCFLLVVVTDLSTLVQQQMAPSLRSLCGGFLLLSRDMTSMSLCPDQNSCLRSAHQQADSMAASSARSWLLGMSDQHAVACLSFHQSLVSAGC